MRTILCAVMMLIASADICVWAEGHATIKITQATSEPNAPAATPTPDSPAPAPAQTAAEPKLIGIAARNKRIGNSMTGTEDGKALTEYYAADGTAKSMLGN